MRKEYELTIIEADKLERIVRSLILTGKRKVWPYTERSLGIATANGVGKINCLLKQHYPLHYTGPH